MAIGAFTRLIGAVEVTGGFEFGLHEQANKSVANDTRPAPNPKSLLFILLLTTSTCYVIYLIIWSYRGRPSIHALISQAITSKETRPFAPHVYAISFWGHVSHFNICFNCSTSFIAFLSFLKSPIRRLSAPVCPICIRSAIHELLTDVLSLMSTAI